MDKQELIKALQELNKIDDTEEEHYKADELLLQFINDEEISEAFNVIGKWYA